MTLDPNKLRDRIRRKASRSACRYAVIAVGVDARRRFIGIAANRPRYYHSGGGWHAEELLLHRCPLSLSRILLARVGLAGDFLPIEPCERCRRLARKRGVVIDQLQGGAK